jgi:hypothetical protein
MRTAAIVIASLVCGYFALWFALELFMWIMKNFLLNPVSAIK